MATDSGICGRLVLARQRPDGGDPPLSLSDHDAEFDQLVPEPRLEFADPQAWPVPVLQRPSLFDEISQLIKLRPVEGKVDAGIQDQIVLPLAEGDEQSFERNYLVLD